MYIQKANFQLRILISQRPNSVFPPQSLTFLFSLKSSKLLLLREKIEYFHIFLMQKMVVKMDFFYIKNIMEKK